MRVRLTKDKKPLFYYLCTLKENSRCERCKVKNANGNNLDRMIIDEIREMTLEHSDLMLNIKNGKQAIKEIITSSESQIKEINKSIEINNLKGVNLMQLIGKLGVNTPTSITDELGKIEKDTKELHNKLKALESENQVNTLNNKMYQRFKESLILLKDIDYDIIDINTFRNYLHSVIEKIIWDGNTAEIILKYHNDKEDKVAGIISNVL